MGLPVVAIKSRASGCNASGHDPLTVAVNWLVSAPSEAPPMATRADYTMTRTSNYDQNK
jgi:hypothetical protein